MQNIMKRCFSFLLTVILMFAMVSVSGTESGAVGSEEGAEQGKKMVISDVTIHPTLEEVVDSGEDVGTPESFEHNFNSYFEDTSAWDLLNGWSINRRNGYLSYRSTGLKTPGCYCYVDDFGDDFILETRVMIPEFGNCCGLSFQTGERALVIYMRPHDMYITSAAGSYESDEIDISDPNIWYDIKIETYNNTERARVFLNGSCVADVGTFVPSDTRSLIQIFVSSTSSHASEMRVDWMKFTPITYSDDIAVSGIVPDGEYREDRQIQVKADIDDILNAPYVTYRVNGQAVATGEAPEYRTTLQGLPAGEYELTAEYGEAGSRKVPFVILPEQKIKLSTNQTSGGLQVSLDGLVDEGKQGLSVEFFLDGSSVAKATKKPYTATVSATPESHIVTVIIRDGAGKVLHEIAEQWAPDFANGQASLNYANEVSYTVAGTSGTADVVVGNGNHLLQLTHSPQGVIFQTAEGMETHTTGLGKFTVLTDGPFAEVYRNGQLVFAYLMPKTDTAESYTGENGLQITDFSLSIPEERRNHFVERNLNTQNTIYDLSGLDSWNNMDFVAGVDDEFELALNDGYYVAKISLEDGKFYAWTVFEEKSVPEKKEIATVVSGDVYYRVEMAGGMARLYADGEWIGSFRGILSTGSPQIGINITAGSLDYLAVNDYTDLYLYQDDFSGTGDFETIDYWRLTNLEAEVDTTAGTMTLDGARKENAIAELNAYAGNVNLSAEVELTKCKGGFWFILNHGIQEEYSKIGYNGITGRFELVDVMEDTSGVTATIRSEVEGTLPLNKKVKLTLSLRDTQVGKTVVLSVDGKPVLSHEERDHNKQVLQRGKIGFLLSKSVAKIFGISYRGDGKPLLSVKENNPVPFDRSTFDLIENQDGIVLVGDDAYLYSRNGGKAWRQKSPDALQGCDIVELANGEILSIKMIKEDSGTVRFVSAISTDGGRSYTQEGTVTGSQGAVTTTGNRVCQGESGRIYFTAALPFTENEGAVVVYYSDDNGRNWTAGQTIDYLDMGCSVQEPKMLELENGHCRMWVRTDLGAVAYIDSYDYGVTWDETPKMTQMFSASNCFNVDQDLNQRNVLYMGWPYDNANLAGMIQYPRTRWAIARSDDWGETWEFIGTTLEFTRDLSSVQNMGINVTDDYIVHNANAIADSSNEYSGRYIVLDREKQVATQRFEQLHLRYPTQIDEQAVVNVKQKKESVAVNLESGNAVVGNKFIPGGSMMAGVLLDFNSGSFVPDGNFLIGSGMTYDNVNGMTLNGGQLRYTPAENYTPIFPGEKYVCFTAKLPDESNVMEVLFQSPEGGGGRGSFRISADSFATSFLSTVNYNCNTGAGTDWVDYKLVAESSNTVALYMKSETLTDNQWVLAIRGSGFTFDNSPSTGLYFFGQGYVRDAVIYGDTGVGTKVALADAGGAEILAGVSLNGVATMSGSTVKEQEDGSVVFCLCDGKSAFEVLEHDGKKYIDLHAFAESRDLTLAWDYDLILAGQSDSWSGRSLRAFRLATNLMSNEIQ